MNQDMESLARVLEEESRLYHRLSDCLSRKRDALVRLDRRQVAALSQELDVLIAEIRRVSSARTGMVKASAKALGCRGETLRALAEQAPEPYRTRLASLRRRCAGRGPAADAETGPGHCRAGHAVWDFQGLANQIPGEAQDQCRHHQNEHAPHEAAAEFHRQVRTQQRAGHVTGRHRDRSGVQH